MKPALQMMTASRGRARGSALILAVVLTSLLAVIGVLFVLVARIDKMASSATADNRTLSLAVDTVLAQIGETLVQDVPGVGTNQEYYDYPDANNAWLANAAPYAKSTPAGAEYYWRQLSSLTGLPAASVRDVRAGLVGEREPINLTEPNANADADGDGVGDARWFQVPDIASSRGKPLYAAVRILDNGGMLNVNTGYRFDANEQDPNLVNGSSQLQINVLALGKAAGSAQDLLNARGIRATPPWNLAAYEQRVVWWYPDTVRELDPNNPSPYRPFDLSDELEQRYRYLLNRTDVDSRLETWGLFRNNSIVVPVDSRAQLDAWFRRVGGGAFDPNYALRTIATTYNADRILTPRTLLTTDTGKNLSKMVNVNRATKSDLFPALVTALIEADPNARQEKVLQITANLLDYIDDDDEITVMPGGSSLYYGFERPCIYLSELAYRQVKDPNTGELHASYAVELFRPYFEDRDPKPGDWKLVIDNPSVSDREIDITWSGSRRFHVLLAEDPLASLRKDYVQFVDRDEPANTLRLYGYNRNDPNVYARTPQDLGKTTFESGATISLQRRVSSAGKWIVVDYTRVPDGWITADGVARSLQRDISPYKCIRRLWSSEVSTPGLGNAVGNYVDAAHPERIQAHPANKPLTNIGELGMIFACSAYNVRATDTAADCLIDLRNPAYRRLFNYLTVIDPWDPVRRPWIGADETRIMGRINVNTAPAFVLGQLPWMQYEDTSPLQKAYAIVAERDSSRGPFQSIGDLMRVDPLCVPAFDGLDNQHNDLVRGPDLTPDTARDDMEERDLIFTRISNLVTVRSDVFTAYILVRIGTDGPQKRMLAILDRSKVTSAGDRVRLVALCPVPDPR